MSFLSYIKEKLLSIIFGGVLFIAIVSLLFVFQAPSPLIISIMILMLTFPCVTIGYDYIRKRKFYDEFESNMAQLDQKYLITEIVNTPDFLEGKIFFEALYEINKSMLETIDVHKNNTNDFKEYIEMWIHEVKIPISSTVLMLHNNQPNMTEKVKEQMTRIENYVDQVLYFVRSENVEKDYLIRQYPLKDIVNKVIRRNKDSFLLKQIAIETKHLNGTVLTDSKWLEFIINQIVSNSIKYANSENATLQFKTEVVDEYVCLDIIDNGIGIQEKDIHNVFNKSFTGENGRHLSNSTGMGLYLVKKLCDKLGHQVKINSVPNQYTKVAIYFMNDKYYSDVT